MSDSETEAVLS